MEFERTKSWQTDGCFCILKRPKTKSERGKKTRQTEEEVGRQHQRMDRPGLLEFAKSQRAVEYRGK